MLKRLFILFCFKFAHLNYVVWEAFIENQLVLWLYLTRDANLL